MLHGSALSAGSNGKPEQLLCFAEALEFVQSGRFECKIGSRQQDFRGGQNEHLARLRGTRNTCSFVNGKAPHIVGQKFHLARVNAGTYRNAEAGNGDADGARATNGARQPIERGEKSIARCLNLATPETIDLDTRLMVVVHEELAPRASPSRLSCAVESTMSVMSRAASTRSPSVGAARTRAPANSIAS
jgi:hypothetical protein